MPWIAVALGGALGSMARHGVNLVVTHRLERTVPNGTFIVNIVGCLIIGALAGGIAVGRLDVGPMMRTFVFVGLLGGFTTFSSFGLDSFTLAHSGDFTGAIANVAGQLLLGLGGVWLGFFLAS